MRRVIKSDIPLIQSWFARRDLTVPSEWFFSNEGAIEYNVAAGFLYLTNSGIAHIDCYVTNPTASLKKKAEALENITELLIYIAKNEQDVRMLCCTTKIRSIKRLAIKFGFDDSGSHMSFAKILNVCPPLKG